jgi:choline monooxygenase
MGCAPLGFPSVPLDTTLSARYYVDPAVFAIERNTIFAPAWNLVAYEYQLQQPGDYVTENLAGWPLFVRRNNDGSLGGFHNVCPHRAGPIVWDGVGCQASLVCRYHGWAFDQDGALLSARDFGAEPDENPALTPVRVQSWRGMVFVCLSPDTPDLHEWLGDFPAHCAEYPVESYSFYWKSQRTMACNWKTYADNFNEGYHLPTVHRLTLARAVDSMRYRVLMFGDPRWNLHEAPPRDRTEWTGVWGYFWPTFSFNIFDGGMAIERWLPRGHAQSELIFEYFFSDEAAGIEDLVKESEEVADEDVLVCEHVQRNLTSGLYESGSLSPRHEHALAAFRDLVRGAVDPHLAG